MGVSKVGSSWRASKMIKGKSYVSYHNSPELAQEEFERLDAISKLATTRFHKRSVKRKNAKAQDLPVGFTDTVDRKRGPNGAVYEHRLLRYTYNENGKTKTIARSYSNSDPTKRSRADAVKEIQAVLKTR